MVDGWKAAKLRSSRLLPSRSTAGGLPAVCLHTPPGCSGPTPPSRCPISRPCPWQEAQASRRPAPDMPPASVPEESLILHQQSTINNLPPQSRLHPVYPERILTILAPRVDYTDCCRRTRTACPGDARTRHPVSNSPSSAYLQGRAQKPPRAFVP